MMRRLGAGLVAVLLVLVPAACGDESTTPPKVAAPTLEPVPEHLEVPADRPAVDPRQVLALLPADTLEVTLTDWATMRDRLGFPGLDGQSLMTDRSAFWERARSEGLALAEGLLRDQASRLWLDHDLSQDDVAWEAHFRTPEGAGHVLAFRPGLAMTRVKAAVRDRATGLDGTVLVEERLLVEGIAEPGEPVLASVPGVVDLLDENAESSYLRTDCVPSSEALGEDATVEDLDRLLAVHDIRFLRPLDTFAVNFDGPVVTARMEPDRADLAERTELIEDWPATGPIVWSDGFDGLPVADPSTGRIGLQIRNPIAAVNLVLAGRIPFAVCNEVEPIAEPTGL